MVLLNSTDSIIALCLSRREILFPSAEKVFKKAAADRKIAKIKIIPLKEKKLIPILRSGFKQLFFLNAA
ncbi:hypothetical protein D1614_05265 [Maribellus luteus]|uniref:Uncharacterized protein n=1 Tax=Maribellus luteus TaxID=2305463 RepID=A0A399T1I6_9BACT|nr:hypothetical protein D1614_05265 [Maribellus luteus]